MNVHFLSGVVVLSVEQGLLCGQKNNADPFAPLSSRETSSNERGKEH